MQLQEELKGTIEESKLVQEKYRQLLDQARKDLAAKHAECEELRTQVNKAQTGFSDHSLLFLVAPPLKSGATYLLTMASVCM